MNEWRIWFDSRLENAIEATEIETKLENGESMLKLISLIDF